MPKHYEVRLGCYHLESSGAYAAVEGVEHGEEREAAAVEALSTSAEGVVGPVKAHASVPSLVSGPAPWFAICGNSNCIQRHGGHAIHVVQFLARVVQRQQVTQMWIPIPTFIAHSETISY